MQVTPKAARVNKGLTQADVAQYMGVSVDVIKRIEAGKRPLKVTEMEKLCELYECSFDDIFLLDRVKKLLAPAGFSRISVTTADQHDIMIAE